MSKSPRTGIQPGKSIGLTTTTTAASSASFGGAGTRGSRSRQYASFPWRGTSSRIVRTRDMSNGMGATHKVPRLPKEVERLRRP